MHAVLRKRLTIKPMALPVGREDGVKCVRDIVAVSDGAGFQGVEAGRCTMMCCHLSMDVRGNLKRFNYRNEL